MQPFDNYPAPPPRAAGPSSAQKALAVVAIMLGAMGVLGGCCGAATNIASGTLLAAQGEWLGAEGMPGAEQQRSIVAASQEIAAKYTPYLVLVQLLNIIASILLVVAGAFTLSVKENAGTLMLVGCGANAFNDMGIAAVTLLQQMESQRVLAGVVVPPGGDPNMQRVMETSMQTGMFVGACFVAGWLLVKLAFYITASVVNRSTPS